MASSGARAQPGETPPPLPPASSPTPEAPPPDEAPKAPLGPLPTGLVPPPEPQPPPAPPPFELPPQTLPRAPRAAAKHGYATSDWDLLFSLNGEVDGISYPNPSVTSSALEGSGGATLTRFLSPVVDDDAPRSLQPFLQRASSVFAQFSLGGFVTTTNVPSMFGPSPESKRTDTNLGPNVGLNLYVTPVFAITAGFAYRYDALSDENLGPFAVKTHSLTPRAGLALRFGDTRIDLSYAFEGDIDTDFGPQKPLWGMITLEVVSVIDRFVDLDFTGQAFDSGAGTSATIEVYPTKDAGVFATGFGSAGRKYLDRVSHNDYGGDIGVSLWLAPQARLLLQYQLAGSTEPLQHVQGLTYGSSELRNSVSTSLLLRL